LKNGNVFSTQIQVPKGLRQRDSIVSYLNSYDKTPSIDIGNVPSNREGNTSKTLQSGNISSINDRSLLEFRHRNPLISQLNSLDQSPTQELRSELSKK
jgi:hypothetical protein